MAMQYDVKSFHASSSTIAYAARTRLKGVITSPTSSTVFNTAVLDTAGALSGTYNIPGSTTCTVTIANHGLANGDRVGLDFTSGTATDDCYTVANVSTNTFTVTTASLTTSGNVTMYPNILTEIDCASGTAFYTLIPGEGILAQEGLFCLLPGSVVTTTIFYG